MLMNLNESLFLINTVSFFLGFSIIFYCLFAGADFGGGILEFFLSKEERINQQELISHTMGPVWEANHVWLIIAVVILFNAFPLAFSELSITFHIPILIMLIGIILRGCSFTFRHYDVSNEKETNKIDIHYHKSQKYYSWIFRISSILTPLFLGMIAGGIMLGRSSTSLFMKNSIQNPNDFNYYNFFIAPWFNLFCFAIGIFVCHLFAFLAAIYLIGESEDQKIKNFFIQKAKIINGLSVISGIFVFASAQIIHYPLFEIFISNPFSILSMTAATLIFFPLWYSLKIEHSNWARVFAAAQVCCIILGWFAIRFPILINQGSLENNLTIYNSAAPESTLKYLLYALFVGVIFIFPCLIYLLRVFQKSSSEKNTYHPLNIKF